MIRVRTILCLILVALPVSAFAAPAQPSSADELLKSKGLKRIGNTYVLDYDANLLESLRPMRKTKHDVELAERVRKEIEDEIRTDEDALANWVAQRDRIGAEQAKYKGIPVKYNELLVQYNALNAKIGLGATQIERRQNDLQNTRVPQKEYFDALAKFLDDFKSTSDAYAKLAADAEVTDAIKTASGSSKYPYRLGPSAAFRAEEPEYKKLQAESQAGIIKLNIRANTAHVTVTINDRVDVDMIVDSGASDVVLSPTVADRLGIRLKKTDRIGQAKIANGQTVDIHFIKVNSIRLGPFTVENVECSVQPDAKKDSECLLGGAFLRNFAYQMDLTNGELHLSQISGRPAEKTAVAVAASTAAAPSKPAAVTLGKPMMTMVKAGTGWTKTDMELEKGKCYQIAVSGLWTNSNGQSCGGAGVCPARWASPLGPMSMSKEQTEENYIGQNPRSSLIARIDSSKPGFFVGSGAKFLAPVSGKLEFAMNDGDEESSSRQGQLRVTVSEIKPQWIADGGSAVIRARIDSKDFLHITPAGLYWEWGGAVGKVGEHSGHYPTIVNGIYWWPKWVTDTTTATQVMQGLNPSAKIHVNRVLVSKGDVEVSEISSSDTTLIFKKGAGFGSREVSAEVQVSKN